MKKPFFQKPGAGHPERGITMVLVAVAMVAIIAMAALSIDVITLYLAKEEAQRTADAAALAAAKIIALSGITGDPSNTTTNWSFICGTTGVATQAAQAVAEQNAVSRVPPASIVVTYSGGSGASISTNNDCSKLNSTAFGVNPLVTVKVTSTNLPSFFSRIWGNPGQIVSGTATAEAFNPSNSGNEGNQTTGALIPVQPRCVKPWIVPNLNPVNTTCTTNCPAFVSPVDGSIQRQGISLNGGSNPGVIGETFWLMPDCMNNPNKCMLLGGNQQPEANYTVGPSPFPTLLYVPNQVGNSPIAVASRNNGDTYNQDIVGCDQAANYQCGVKDANLADLTIGPVGDTTEGVACLIHQTYPVTSFSASTGQDYLNATTFAQPNLYPFQIMAGSANPVVAAAGLGASAPITVSPSIVSLPIYDTTEGVSFNSNSTTQLTFVGFLQVFINAVDANGDMLVTVLNVAGCSNTASAPPVNANSPLPVRLITPP